MKGFGKRCSFLLAVILALSMLLTACGGNTASSSNGATGVTNAGTDTAPNEATDNAAKLDPVTLRMVIAGPPQADQAKVDQAISDYLKDKINVTLKVDQYEWGAWQDKYNLIIASGEDCDLTWTAAWCGYPVDASKGAFVELSDLLNKYGKDILKTDYTWTLDVAKVNGGLYAIPTYQMLAQSKGFFLRKDLVDKYAAEAGFQIKDVNKPEDLEPMLKIIKEKEPDIIPFYGLTGKQLADMGLFDRQGSQDATTINLNDQNPQYINFYETDYYKSAMALQRQWYLKGYTNKDIATTQEAAQTLYGQGKVFAWLGETNVGADQSYSISTGNKTVMYPLTKPMMSTSLVQGAMFAIPRQTKNPERAMMFLNLMQTDKTLINMLVYGIEGVHYVKTGDNSINTAPGIDPSKLPYYNNNWMFGDQSKIYIYGDSDPNGAEALKAFNDNAVRTPALGFIYDPSKKKNELAALANVASEFNPQLSSGAVDPNAGGLYNKFLEKLKSAGVDKLLEDQNSQLNAWKEANIK